MANYKLTAGQRIVGATSGAKATVAVTVTSGTSLYVMDVEGTFQQSEFIRVEWDTSTAINANQLHATQANAVRSYTTDRVRQVYQHTVEQLEQVQEQVELQTSHAIL